MDYPDQNGHLAAIGHGGGSTSPAPAGSAAIGSAVAESRFHCHICEEPSEEICPRCTRDVIPDRDRQLAWLKERGF